MGIANHAYVAEVLESHRRRNHQVDTLNQIENQIDIVWLVWNGEDDHSLWRLKEDSFKSKFSSKHTWHQIREINLTCEWYKGVWFPFSTPRYSFLTWLAFHDRLATGDKLRNWDAGARISCVFCGESLETRDHLFFSCPYSSQVWSSLTRGILHNHYTTSLCLDSSHLVYTFQPKLHTFTLRYVFQISIHSLWREHNGRRHGNSPIPSTKLVRIIDKNIRNRFNTVRMSGNSDYEEGLRYWFHTGIL